MEGLNQPAGGAVRHLYVHVPYCHKICPYCAFYKHLPSEGGLATYADALLAEARQLKAGPVPLDLETVYFGGGTPTLLSTRVLANLLPELARTLDFQRVGEWTMEVNPRTITAEKAEVMRQAGVSRVSLGVQAWDVPTLATLGRDHAPEEAEHAFTLLRAAGFPVVNIDLMFSVPGRRLWIVRSHYNRITSRPTILPMKRTRISSSVVKRASMPWRRTGTSGVLQPPSPGSTRVGSSTTRFPITAGPEWNHATTRDTGRGTTTPV